MILNILFLPAIIFIIPIGIFKFYIKPPLITIDFGPIKIVVWTKHLLRALYLFCAPSQNMKNASSKFKLFTDLSTDIIYHTMTNYNFSWKLHPFVLVVFIALDHNYECNRYNPGIYI